MRGVYGSGEISKIERPTHQIKYAGRWFRTQEGVEQFKYDQNLRRRAKAAGFSNTELDKFLVWEERTKLELKAKKEREKREREERDALRAKYGLHPKAHVTGLRNSVKIRHEARTYLAKKNREHMTDSEKLEYIKGLYRNQSLSRNDLLIRIGQIVGVM